MYRFVIFSKFQFEIIKGYVFQALMNIIFYAIIIHWLIKATAYVPRTYDFKKKQNKKQSYNKLIVYFFYVLTNEHNFYIIMDKFNE